MNSPTPACYRLFGCALLAIVAAIATWPFIAEAAQHTPKKLSDLADSLASVAGAFGGFLLTAIALLAALMDRKLVRSLRQSGHFDFLLMEAFAGVLAFLALALTASLTRLVGGQLLLWMSVGNVFLSVAGAYLIISIGRKFFVLITELVD